MLAPKYWLSWALVAMAWLVARLPLTWILALGRCLGHIVYRLGGSRRHIAEVNIKLCFPELSDVERAQLVKEPTAYRHGPDRSHDPMAQP